MRNPNAINTVDHGKDQDHWSVEKRISEPIKQSFVSLEQLTTATEEGEETSDEKSESTIIA